MKITIKSLPTLPALLTLGLLTAGTAGANSFNFSAPELAITAYSQEFDNEILAADSFNGAFSKHQNHNESDSVPDYVNKYSDDQSLVRSFLLPWLTDT